MGSLDPERWTALTPYLDQALDLSDEQRAIWLDRLREEHPAVAAELAALFDRYHVLVEEGFLEGRPLPRSLDLSGQTVGSYTLKSPIGHGGMGTVWLAERSDGRFERQAAVKFLNMALAGHGDIRFRREGRLLARLTHPQIAQLLDAGVAPSGQPYLVLEHVDGEPIDRYCHAHALDVRARVLLFLDVLAAVAHAHANLIVHRDIKPSNVLVTRDGQVKLLDFGIAKLLEDDIATGGAPMLTADGEGALTPEYAAPEQLSGEPVSTATDVYQLGVLLFVLFTGRHPAGSGVRSAAGLIKAIVETDAPRPSDVVTDVRTRRLLRGDLDTIVGKALRKTPAERYASVTAMADDLRRHVRHEPIGARPDTLTYRAAKFIRRHRWPVVAALVAFMLLSAALLVADRQRRVAESRFRQLRQLSQQVFALDTRLRDLPGATEARQSLVAASLEYLEGLASDALGDLDLVHEVSDGYWRVARIQGVPVSLTLGNFAQAEESLKKADALVERVLASRPRDLRALELSASIRHDRMIVADSERRDADALSHARGAVERIEMLVGDPRVTPEQRESVMRLYPNVALANLNLRRYEDAAGHARRHIELARAHGAAPRQVSYSLSLLANALRLQGDLDGALTAIRDAREIADRTSYTSETDRMIDRYALLLREGFILGEDRAVSLGRPEDAIASLREAFEMQEAGARRDPNDYTSRTRVGTSGRELGNILRWRDPRDAVVVYDAALARLAEIKNNVKARRDTALVLASSAYALRRLNRVADARQRVDEALSILTATKDYPADRIPLDGELYTVLVALADHHADEGQLTRAIAEYNELLAKVMATKPDVENDLREANNVSLLYEGLARLHRLSGGSDKAEALESRRMALWQHWNRKLPNNSFVARRLAPADPASSLGPPR